MAGFSEIVGHKEIIRHLQNSITMGKVSHAYIISGETGSGKTLLASSFAMTLQCQKKGADPCLECSSCKRAMSRNHPDIIYVKHEKPNTFTIDDIRTQVIDDVAIKPYCSSYKVYIIKGAERLTLQAQNALLKTIEEPLAYAVILLLTSNQDALLPTITSRCVKLSLRPVNESMVKEYLMETMHLPDYEASLDAAFSQGSIGRARKMAESEEFSLLAEKALYLLKKSKDMEWHELLDMLKELGQNKESIYEYLDLYIMWFRDVLLYKATRDVDGVVFKNQLNSIKERAKRSSYEGIEKIIDAVGTAKERLHANVNFELVMELLFMTIKEN